MQFYPPLAVFCSFVCASFSVSSPRALAETSATKNKLMQVEPTPTLLAIKNLPTGKLLAYCENGEKIVVVNARGEAVFTTDGESPVLSRDGKKIVFTREAQLPSPNGLIYHDDLWVANLDGKSAPRQLTSTRDSEYAPSWNPDGTQIVFATRLNNQGGNGYGLIEIINADGTKRHKITKNEGATQPSWSPDGKTIAFVKMGIWRMDVNGRKTVRLIDSYSAGEPSWSPNGKLIAYSDGEDESVTSRDGGRDGPIIQSTDSIYLIRADVSVAKSKFKERVSRGNFDFQRPVWSADSQWILGESDKDGEPLPVPLYDESVSRGPYNLYAIKRGSDEMRRITLGDKSYQNASWR